MNVTVRSWKSSFMNLIGTESSELSALHSVNCYCIFDFVYTLTSANIDQSAPNLGKMFMSNRIWMSSIMGPIGLEQLELFALELGNIAAFDFVYSLSSTNINQSAPNLVTVNITKRSQMSLIVSQVIPDQSVLSALEIEKLNSSSLFGTYVHC